MSVSREEIRTVAELEHFHNPNHMLDVIEAQFRPAWEPGGWEHWRHGGWYVGNLHYPSGAVGCVSNNYADRKWRIACDPRPFEEQPTFRTRREAAIGERDLIQSQILSDPRQKTKIERRGTWTVAGTESAFGHGAR